MCFEHLSTPTGGDRLMIVGGRSDHRLGCFRLPPSPVPTRRPKRGRRTIPHMLSAVEEVLPTRATVSDREAARRAAQASGRSMPVSRMPDKDRRSQSPLTRTCGLERGATCPCVWLSAPAWGCASAACASRRCRRVGAALRVPVRRRSECPSDSAVTHGPRPLPTSIAWTTLRVAAGGAVSSERRKA